MHPRRSQNLPMIKWVYMSLAVGAVRTFPGTRNSQSMSQRGTRASLSLLSNKLVQLHYCAKLDKGSLVTDQLDPYVAFTGNVDGRTGRLHQHSLKFQCRLFTTWCTHGLASSMIFSLHGCLHQNVASCCRHNHSHCNLSSGSVSYICFLMRRSIYRSNLHCLCSCY